MQSLKREIKVDGLGFKCDVIDLSEQSSYCFYHIYCYIYSIWYNIVCLNTYTYIKFINGCLLKYRVLTDGICYNSIALSSL